MQDESPDRGPARQQSLVQGITVVAIVTIAFAGVCVIVALTSGSGNQLALIAPMIGFAGVALNQMMSTWRAERATGQIHQDVQVVKQQTNGELDARIQKSVVAAVAEAVPAAVAPAVAEAVGRELGPVRQSIAELHGRVPPA
jgi:hypothetical protein